VIYPLAVGLALVTSVTAPSLIRHSGALSHGIERLEPRFLKNLIEIYHAGLGRIEQRQQGSMLWQLTRRRLIQMAIELLFVTGLLAFSERLSQAMFGLFGTEAIAQAWRVGFWSGLGVVALVPLIAIWRNVTALATIFAEAVTNDAVGAGILRGAVETGIKAVSAVTLGIWLWLLLPIDLTTIWTVSVITLMLIVLVVLLRTKFIRLHHRVETHLEGILTNPEEQQERNPEALLHPYREWNIHVHELVVADDSRHAGKSLADLQLRQQFGCSVAGVDRHGYPVPNPGPEFVLYPGDTLLVLATEDASNRARAFLNQPREMDAKTDLLAEIEIEGVGVPPGSPAAEKMLVELEIPASTGVQLVGIERGGNRLLNPGPFQGVEAGDQLLALGTPEQIRNFRKWLSAVSPDGSPGP
jgi:CPA2 family monovalent cation:H+ antiporter-2